MSAQLLIGKEIGSRLKSVLSQQVSDLNPSLSNPISLLTVQLGEAKDASLYSRAIGRMCDSIGIKRYLLEIVNADTESEAIKRIHAEISAVQPTGVLLLSPIPNHLQYNQIITSIPISLDAEGSRYDAVGDLVNKAYPPTALAVLETIRAANQNLQGLNAVVVGRSRIVGKPVADLLLSENATVTICHSKTKDLAHFIRHADVVVAAVGKAKLIQGDWIKSGAIVSDAGENVLDGSPIGDVDFETAKLKAGYITPVPQGVGPLTTLMLAKNLLALAENQSK